MQDSKFKRKVLYIADPDSLNENFSAEAAQNALALAAIGQAAIGQSVRDIMCIIVSHAQGDTIGEICTAVKQTLTSEFISEMVESGLKIDTMRRALQFATSELVNPLSISKPKGSDVYSVAEKMESKARKPKQSSQGTNVSTASETDARLKADIAGASIRTPSQSFIQWLDSEEYSQKEAQQVFLALASKLGYEVDLETSLKEAMAA